MEYWDIVDKNGNLTGRRVRRDRLTLKNGEYHPVVHIWVFHNNRFLIQKRSAEKQPMAGEWAATGGAVISGESALGAARRELAEELSIDAQESELCFIARMTRKNSMLDIFSLHRNVDADSLTLQEGEVEEVKWVGAQQLRDMIKNGEFHNYGFDYFKNVFSLVK